MQKSKKSRSSNNKKNTKKCGGDASNWVSQVVGDYPHHAGLGNIIKQNVPAINMTGGFSGSDVLNPGNSVYTPISGAPPAYNIAVTTPGVAPISHGGRRKKNKTLTPKTRHNRSHSRRGGSVISEIAVPAVLLVANQVFKKNTGNTYMKKNKSRRFSRRFR